jgi:hypothetical protein
MPSDFDREFLLKATQAWLDLKIKVLSYLVIANGVAIATAVSILKDDPLSAPANETLKSATTGLAAGALAILVVSLLGEATLEKLIKFAASKTRVIDASALAHPFVSLFLWLLAAISFLSFSAGIWFLCGYVQAGIDICDKSPSKCAPSKSIQQMMKPAN